MTEVKNILSQEESDVLVMKLPENGNGVSLSSMRRRFTREHWIGKRETPGNSIFYRTEQSQKSGDVSQKRKEWIEELLAKSMELGEENKKLRLRLMRSMVEEIKQLKGEDLKERLQEFDALLEQVMKPLRE